MSAVWHTAGLSACGGATHSAVGDALPGGAPATRPGVVRHRAGWDRSGAAWSLRRGAGEARFPWLRPGWLQRWRDAGTDDGRAQTGGGLATTRQAAISDGRWPAGGPPGRY